MTSAIDELFFYLEELRHYLEEVCDGIESEIREQRLFDELKSKKQELSEAIEKEMLEFKAFGREMTPYDQSKEDNLLHFVMSGLLDVKLLKYFTITNIKEPNEVLANAICHDNIEAVKWLLDNGVSPSSKDEDGDTMLQLALWNGNSEGIAELLIERGADVDDHNTDGHTALDIAIMELNLPIIELLLKSGAQMREQSINQVIYRDFQNETTKSKALLLMLGSSQGIKIDPSSSLIYQFFTDNHNIKGLFAIDGYEVQKVIVKEKIYKSLQNYAQAYNDQKALEMAEIVSEQQIGTISMFQDYDLNHKARLSGDFDNGTLDPENGA